MFKFEMVTKHTLNNQGHQQKMLVAWIFIVSSLHATNAGADNLQPQSLKNRCHMVITKAKRTTAEFVQTHNGWIRRLLQPSINRRMLNDASNVTRTFIESWKPLRENSDPSVDYAFHTIWNWENSVVPQKSAAYQSPWFAYNPRRDLGGYHGLPVGKHRIFQVGNDSNVIILQILTPTQTPQGATVQVRVAFSSQIAAGIVGKLIERALKKTETARGAGLPLMGGTWHLDFMPANKIEAEVNRPLANLSRNVPILFFSPALIEHMPAVTFTLPIAREVRGYELLLAHLVDLFDSAANRKLKASLESDLPFTWASKACRRESQNFAVPLSEISTAENPEATPYLRMLNGMSGHQPLDGDGLYAIADAILPTFVALSEAGQMPTANIRAQSFPAITKQEATRLNDAAHTKLRYPQAPPE